MDTAAVAFGAVSDGKALPPGGPAARPDTSAPDAWGYTWVRSNEPGGPTFGWIDITSRPGRVIVTGLTDDNVAGPFPMLFNFKYYWYDVNTFTVGSNGYIAFGNQPSAFAPPFAAMPNTSNPNNIVAPCVGDLVLSGQSGAGGQCVYWSNGVDTLIVSYIDVTEWEQTINPANTHTFQIVFTKRDSTILFQYGAQRGRYNTTNNTRLKILETARVVKTIFPRINIILGGPEVGPIASKYLGENSFLDIIVKREGEVTVAELLKYCLGEGRLEEIQGISYRVDRQVFENPARPLLEDLGAIPSPYLEGVLIPRDKVTYLETYRGCIFRCGYCFEGKNFPRPRFFPEDRIKKEVEFIMSNPEIKSFHFVDPIFNLKKERLEKIAGMLHTANCFGTELRTIEIIAEFVDEETIDLFKKANVKSVETGPQTVNKDTLKNVNRYYDEEKFRKAVRLLEDNKMPPPSGSW